MAFETAGEALAALENANAEYVAAARAVALQLGQGGAIVTVDDIRAICPPPEEIEPRVMGCILRRPTWVKTGYRDGARRTSHKRPISEFKLAEYA